MLDPLIAKMQTDFAAKKEGSEPPRGWDSQRQVLVIALRVRCRTARSRGQATS